MTNNGLLWITFYKSYEIHLNKIKNGFRLNIFNRDNLNRYKIILDPVHYIGIEEKVAHDFINDIEKRGTDKIILIKKRKGIKNGVLQGQSRIIK